MKQIIKKSIPGFFSKFVAHNKPRTWDEATPIRSQLRTHILTEQGHCCAYSEIRLNGGADCHIDHYRTRNLFPEKTFDYYNMMVSCNAEEYGTKFKDKRITSKSDYNDLINPVEDNPLDYIEFAFTGDALPVSNSSKGEKTITYFNLNENSLLERRKTIALYIVQMKNYLTEDELVEVIGEFESMVRQLYRNSTAQ